MIYVKARVGICFTWGAKCVIGKFKDGQFVLESADI